MQKPFSFILCLAAILLALFMLFQPGHSWAYTITATAGKGGKISPSGAVTVSGGVSQTFFIKPFCNNTVADVLIDGGSIGTPSTITFFNVTSDHSIEVAFNVSAEFLDISPVPMSAIKRAAPPNIMFVLDDSGSMDCEFLTQEWNGLFDGLRYVFDDPGDNVFSGSSYILSGSDRKQWKSQWSGYNRLYYDPGANYEPWPTNSNVSSDTPPSHPMNATPAFALNDRYYLFDFSIIVDNEDMSPLYQESGFWDESMYEPEYPEYNGTARYTNEIGPTATFTPDLPEADTYDVYAWWNCWTGRDTNAKITVTYNGGTNTIYRNQSADVDNVPVCYGPPDLPCCGQWIPLGTWPFAAGTAGSVTIERNAVPDGSSTVADAVKFVPTSRAPIDIKNAHYYTFEDVDTDGQYDVGEPVYLVVIEGTGGTYTIRYFRATPTGSGGTEEITLLDEVAEASVPDSVRSTRSAADERQNFANWYSYYRRRELTAAAAVANIIHKMEGVNIGFYSINGALVQPVLSVKAGGEDYTADLLNGLYNMALVPDT
jgi:type IV pilus assembly protein PilY1